MIDHTTDATCSADLVWACVRRNNSFKRTNAAATRQKGLNKIHLTSEKGNIASLHTFKHSAISNVRSFDMQRGEGMQIKLNELVSPELMALNNLPEKFKSADTNRDGQVSFKEFVAIYLKMSGLPPPRVHVAKFHACDKDRSGSISMSEFLAFQMGGNQDYQMTGKHLSKMNKVISGNIDKFRPDLKDSALKRLSALDKANRKAKALAKQSA